MANFGTPPFFSGTFETAAPLPPQKEKVDVVLEGVFQKIDLVGFASKEAIFFALLLSGISCVLLPLSWRS